MKLFIEAKPQSVFHFASMPHSPLSINRAHLQRGFLPMIIFTENSKPILGSIYRAHLFVCFPPIIIWTENTRPFFSHALAQAKNFAEKFPIEFLLLAVTAILPRLFLDLKVHIKYKMGLSLSWTIHCNKSHFLAFNSTQLKFSFHKATQRKL